MEAVILMGLQASGKTSFCRERLYATHLRIGLDLLKTRHRERRFFELCLETRQRFVVDDTNVSRAERARFLSPALEAGFRAVGYWFRSEIAACLARNALRTEAERIPEIGVRGTAKRLEMPTLAEGFHRLHFVRLEPTGFVVEDWREEMV